MNSADRFDRYSHDAAYNELDFVCATQAELQRSLQASESSAAAAQEALSEKEMELRELKSQKAAEQGLISREDHEALRLSLQAEINAIMARFNDLTRKHEKTCTEVRTCVCVCVIVSAHPNLSNDIQILIRCYCVCHKVSRVP